MYIRDTLWVLTCCLILSHQDYTNCYSHNSSQTIVCSVFFFFLRKTFLQVRYILYSLISGPSKAQTGKKPLTLPPRYQFCISFSVNHSLLVYRASRYIKKLTIAIVLFNFLDIYTTAKQQSFELQLSESPIMHITSWNKNLKFYHHQITHVIRSCAGLDCTKI